MGRECERGCEREPCRRAGGKEREVPWISPAPAPGLSTVLVARTDEGSRARLFYICITGHHVEQH